MIMMKEKKAIARAARQIYLKSVSSGAIVIKHLNINPKIK
jgi:hypothetical protein